MAKTSWLHFTVAPNALDTDEGIIDLTGDLAGLMLGDEVTILKVIGELEYFIDATVAASSLLQVLGLTVQNLNLIDSEIPSLLASTPSEDSSGFWLETKCLTIYAADALDRRHTINFDTSTKRVMRGDERLILKHDSTATPTANSVFRSGWFRILVLSG